MSIFQKKISRKIITNLKYLTDFQEIQKIPEKYDGIVTDLPYGLDSKASEKPEEILKKFRLNSS